MNTPAEPPFAIVERGRIGSIGRVWRIGRAGRPRSRGFRVPPTVLAGLVVAMVALGPSSSSVRAADETEGKVWIEQMVDVAPVWSGHSVEFALLTHGRRQLVAFYDPQRQMTVGCRGLDSTTWHFVRLPLPSDETARRQDRPPVTKLGWDSHNGVTLAVDADDCVHLSGNMHCAPLLYFRTTRPMDIDSFRWQPGMTGQRERKATYPEFLTGPDGELIFTYRDGGSGNGDQLFNLYDAKSQTWSRLFDSPLFSGEGKMNAYFTGPVRDRSGAYHLSWIWRDTPDCSTNHDVCHAQSSDPRHWTASTGKPLALPITLATAEVVDPVPSGGGLSNGDTRIGFDGQGRVVLSYYKFDLRGNTQLYNARREEQGWRIYQTSDWDYRWDLRGTGSIVFEISHGPVIVGRRGELTQSYRHVKHGSGMWRLDAATLKPTGPADPAAGRGAWPPELDEVESKEPMMAAAFASDLGRSEEPGVRYLLRWESRPQNRDRPYPGEPPRPSMARVYRLRLP